MIWYKKKDINKLKNIYKKVLQNKTMGKKKRKRKK